MRSKAMAFHHARLPLKEPWAYPADAALNGSLRGAVVPAFVNW